MSFIQLFKKGKLPQLPKQTKTIETRDAEAEMERNIKLFESKQIPLLPKEKKLEEKDFKHIFKNLKNVDIFGDTCTEWVGVICNKDKPHKGQYINIYHNKKKNTLHRLLYENFKDSHLREKAYLVHTCNNKRCCCINHLVIKKEKDNLKPKEEMKVEFKIDF